ncbi:MAG: glycosyltransferase family 4 protein [Clostridia bacterium]|nr:glycosyltransferase family 4 protein [Clostridia bacterium]
MMHIYLDLSSTIQNHFVSGIQRVVREVVSYMLDCGVHMTLIAEEGETASFYEITREEYLAWESDWTYSISRDRVIPVDALGPEDMFFDIDSSWQVPMTRDKLYRELKKRGVLIGSMIYDIIPVTHPHYVHEGTMYRFAPFLTGVLGYSDFIVCNTHATKDRILALSRKAGCPDRPVFVMPLGATFRQVVNDISENEVSAEIVEATRKPYLLMVGTLEPRKNHSLVLDAFDKGLYRDNINIIIAGRQGWHYDEVLRRIKEHPQYGKRIFYFNHVVDAEITWLYRHAFAMVFATFVEGFGLPLVEALHYSCPVFCSDIPELHETAGDYVSYFDPFDAQTLIDLTRENLRRPADYAARKARLSDYRALTWDEAAGKLTAILADAEKLQTVPDCPELDMPIEQLFILSSRAEDLAETLPYYERYMPWLRRLTILCPKAERAAMEDRLHTRLAVDYLHDEDLLAPEEIPADHALRNLRLRLAAIQGGKLDPVFLMADDDNRPLKPVGEEEFRRDGRFRLFCWHPDLHRYRGAVNNPTSFDRSIAAGVGLLDAHELGCKSYASHCPQVIVRRIWLEAAAEVPEAWDTPIPEWDLYANYAMKAYAARFESVSYRTMNWPARPSDFRIPMPPADYLFENFYRWMYGPGELFDGIPTGMTADADAHGAEKISRRMAVQEEAVRLERSDRELQELYPQLYGDEPGWKVDLRRNLLFTPHVVIGQTRCLRKTDFWYEGDGVAHKLRLSGKFVPVGKGEPTPLQPVEAEMPDGLTVFEWNIDFPVAPMEGHLHLCVTVDGADVCEAVIPAFAVDQIGGEGFAELLPTVFEVGKRRHAPDRKRGVRSEDAQLRLNALTRQVARVKETAAIPLTRPVEGNPVKRVLHAITQKQTKFMTMPIAADATRFNNEAAQAIGQLEALVRRQQEEIDRLRALVEENTEKPGQE